MKRKKFSKVLEDKVEDFKKDHDNTLEARFEKVINPINGIITWIMIDATTKEYEKLFNEDNTIRKLKSKDRKKILFTPSSTGLNHEINPSTEIVIPTNIQHMLKLSDEKKDLIKLKNLRHLCNIQGHTLIEIYETISKRDRNEHEQKLYDLLSLYIPKIV